MSTFLILFSVEDEPYARIVQGDRAAADRLSWLLDTAHTTETQVIELEPGRDDTADIEAEYAMLVTEANADRGPENALP